MTNLAVWRIDESGTSHGGQAPLLSAVERSPLGLEQHLEDWIAADAKVIGGGLTNRRPAGAHRRREARPPGHRRAGPLGGDRTQGRAAGLRSAASGALLCVIARTALCRRSPRDARALPEEVR